MYPGQKYFFFFSKNFLAMVDIVFIEVWFKLHTVNELLNNDIEASLSNDVVSFEIEE